MCIDILPNPSGLYALTRDGRLGVYDERKQFHLDAELTAAFREHIARLLKWYLADGDGERARVGLICPVREPRAWGTTTMFLEETVVRRLYPGGAAEVPLTVFQKKNQEKSIYRGMELLLEYRSKETAVPLFCPVLFDRGRMLNRYLHCLGRVEEDRDATTPVLEVINLITDFPLSQEDTSALRVLQEKLYASVIRKDKRRTAQFTLLDASVVRERRATVTNSYDADARAEREVTLSAAELDKLHVSESPERVGRWLEVPHRPVEPADLRRFPHFRELDGAFLNLLAAKTLIHTAPAGTPLLERGMTDHWNLYLLEGTLVLTAEDGQTSTLAGCTPKAAAPVAFLKPRKYQVTSLTKVSFLWIPDAVLRVVKNTNGIAPRPLSAVC
jgi:hypothetical protein